MDPSLPVHNSVYSARSFELEQDLVWRHLWVLICLDPDAPSLRDYLSAELLAARDEPLGRAAYEVFNADS
ncbi:MAG: hypothetical protein GEU73_05560 [Chloroflexi bacterium]|nr:hypothetical protein [Chloroflexota bacterium]